MDFYDPVQQYQQIKKEEREAYRKFLAKRKVKLVEDIKLKAGWLSSFLSGLGIGVICVLELVHVIL